MEEDDPALLDRAARVTRGKRKRMVPTMKRRHRLLMSVIRILMMSLSCLISSSSWRSTSRPSCHIHMLIWGDMSSFPSGTITSRPGGSQLVCLLVRRPVQWDQSLTLWWHHHLWLQPPPDLPL